MNPLLGPRSSDPADPAHLSIPADLAHLSVPADLSIPADQSDLLNRSDQSDLFNWSDLFNLADPAAPRPASQRPWWSRRGIRPGATALSTIALVLPFAVKFPSDLGD